MSQPLIEILIPSWNNAEYLQPCLNSLLRNHATKGIMHITVINNGHAKSCDWIQSPMITVINAPSNLGWEGGIDLGLKNTKAPYVVFMNDDTYVPPASRLWLNQLVQHFRDSNVAAVGPSSNTVMGLQQMFLDVPYHVFTSTFLIGFCVMMRRSAFEEIGGMDMTLPGGDDLDWSIRLRQAGYKLIVDRSVFIYHHGFKTGERIYGDWQKKNGWNSYEKYSATNLALIKKHGLRVWWDMMKGQQMQSNSNMIKANEDLEGKKIKKLIKKEDKVILDLGCGSSKTLRRAIGVDFVKKGERIPTLEGDPVSDADVEANVAEKLPFEEGSVDVVIARHVLEHMIDPLSALSHWVKVLKLGGKLIIAVPNQEIISSIPMNLEHVHAYSPKSMAVLLGALGLKVSALIDSGNHISFIAVAEK